MMRNSNKFRKKIYPYLYLLPVIIILTFTVFYPVIKAIIMSFQDYSLLKPNSTRFIGFQNYISVFKDEVFWSSLRTTLFFVVFVVAGQFIIGLYLALLLNKRFKARGFIRSLALIPWAVPGVLSGFMWSWMLNGNYGVVNDLLQRIGIIESFIPWTSQPNTALFAVMLAQLWMGIPFFAVMLLAGLQSIPETLHEAAVIDGTNWWQELIYVTIPSIKPIIITTLLLRTIWTANAVDVIMIMTEGGPGYSTYTLAVYALQTAKSSFNYGYASTLAICLGLLLAGFIYLYLRMTNKKMEDKL